jgi:hypothetical protein
MPDTQLRRLQSVLNAAARLIFSARKHDHITPLLRELHWLRFPERLKFRLCVLAYQCLHGAAPSYLAENVHMIADANSRLCLRSASQMMLHVPATRCSTLGDRVFPVAAAQAWNSLPPDVKSAPSLETFRRHLKTHLFNVSFFSYDFILVQCPNNSLLLCVTLIASYRIVIFPLFCKISSIVSAAA